MQCVLTAEKEYMQIHLPTWLVCLLYDYFGWTRELVTVNNRVVICRGAGGRSLILQQLKMYSRVPEPNCHIGERKDDDRTYIAYIFDMRTGLLITGAAIASKSIRAWYVRVI